MKRDELGSCLTEEQNRIMRNMDSDVEKMEYMEKHDPVLYYRMAIGVLFAELQNPSDPLETMVKKSAGTYGEEQERIFKLIASYLVKMRDAEKELGEDYTSTQETIDGLKNSEFKHLFEE